MARTTTIEIRGIPEETLQRLDARVQQQGGDRATYILRLLDQHLSTPPLSEVLAPFRQQVADSGVSEEELEQLFEEAREDAYRERHKSA